MQNGHQYTVRADQKLRDNLSYFAPASVANATQDDVQALPSMFEPLPNNIRNMVASRTMVANPTTVIDWKADYNQTNQEANAADPAPGWPAFLAAHPIHVRTSIRLRQQLGGCGDVAGQTLLRRRPET